MSEDLGRHTRVRMFKTKDFTLEKAKVRGFITSDLAKAHLRKAKVESPATQFSDWSIQLSDRLGFTLFLLTTKRRLN